MSSSYFFRITSFFELATIQEYPYLLLKVFYFTRNTRILLKQLGASIETLSLAREIILKRLNSPVEKAINNIFENAPHIPTQYHFCYAWDV